MLKAMQDDAAARLRDALELADLAERMVLAKLRRDHPELGDDELEALLLAWLQAPREALDGDAEGRRVVLDLRP